VVRALSNIIVTSLHQDFIPSKLGDVLPDLGRLPLLFGTICFFGTLFLLFLKYLPAVAVAEVKELNRAARRRPYGGPHA